jgi:parvulin-like peptidyl-prolyl isomerase
MAQSNPKQEREITRKETTRRRRDEERNRRVVIGLLVVGALLVVVIAAGIIQELVVKPSQPVATVNGAKIGLRDYQKRVKFDWYQAGQVTDPQGTSLQTLDTMVDDQLLREQAKQRGITVTEDEINAAIEKSFGYQRVPPTPVPTATPDPQATPSNEPTATPAPTATPVTLEAYQKAFKDYVGRLNLGSGMAEADFRKVVELDLIRQKLYDAVTADTPTKAEQVRASHILVAIRTPAPTPDPAATPEPGVTPTPTLEPRDDAQALARIIEVQQKLGAGEDFAQVAKQYSDDLGSALQGGDLGWFARGSGLVKEFEDAAFALTPGQVSDPVKTQFGYHLIKVAERDPARELDAYTIQQKKYEAYNKWLTDLRSAAQVDRQWTLSKVPPTPSAQLP